MGVKFGLYIHKNRFGWGLLVVGYIYKEGRQAGMLGYGSSCYVTVYMLHIVTAYAAVAVAVYQQA